MPVPLHIINAFTSPDHQGNPAAVCLLDSPRDDGWMQRAAAQMNLSETAFLFPAEAGTWHLRWFTPAAEVDLCGHATLAAAHALQTAQPGIREVAFHTRSGLLSCTLDPPRISMSFPRIDPVPLADAAAVLEAADLPPLAAAPQRAGRDLLLHLASEADVRTFRPDLPALAGLPFRGTIITAICSTPGADFVSRFFAPAIGVPEDPVTGSAHCALAPYWSSLLGKTSLAAIQRSSRGGLLQLTLQTDRVILAGQAQTAVTGRYLL